MSEPPIRLVAMSRAELAELGDPDAREFLAGNGEWPFRGLVVRANGRIRAYANVCPHKQHPLNFDGDDFLVPGQCLLRCTSHGALFEPESGLCVYGPCAGRSLQALACEITDEGVCVELPPGALAVGRGQPS